MIVCLLFLFGAVLLFFIYRKYICHTYFSRLGIPGPPPHWLFGNIRDIWSERRHEVLSDWSKTYGKFYGYYEGPTPIMVVSSIEAIEQICVRQFSNFQGHKVNPVQPNPEKDATNALSHMFFAQGETWKRLRVNVNPAFSTGKLKSYAPSMAKSQRDLTDLFFEKAKQKESFDIREAFQYLTLDIISQVGFGIEFDAIKTRAKGSVLAERLKAFLDYTTRRQPVIDFLNVLPEIVPFFKMKFLIGVFGPIEMLENVVGKLIASRKANTQLRRNDLLQLMIDSNAGLELHDGSIKTKYKSLTETEIKAQSFLFFFAGYETTSTTLAFLSYLLAKHSNVQEKLFNEISEAFLFFPNGSLELEYDKIMKLGYLDCVCKEAIRLYPIAINFVNRFVVKDTVVCGVPFHKNLGCVQVDVFSMHRDPDLWGPVDPNLFWPERFLPENSTQRPEAAFLGFGYGPRRCIGERLALLEIKMTLVNLLTRFFITEPIYPHELKISSREGLLTALDGVYLRVIKRADKR